MQDNTWLKQLSTEQMMLGGFGVAVVVLLLLLGAAWYGVDRSIETSAWVSHTHEVINSLNKTLSQIYRIEAAQSRVMLGGGQVELDRRNAALGELDAELRKVSTLIADNPCQQERIRLLRKAVAANGAMLDNTIKSYQTHDFVAGKSVLAWARGDDDNSIHKVIAGMMAEESELLLERHDREAHFIWVGRISVVALITFTALFLLLLFLYIRRAMTKQSEEHGRFQTILDHAPFGIWLIGMDRRYRFMNKTFCNAIGVHESRILAAKHPTEVFGPDMAAACIKSDQECLEQDTPHTSYETLLFVDGKLHVLEIVKVKLRDDVGGVIGIIGISTDITERRQFEVRLVHQASHDALTDLPNRFALEQFLPKEIARSQRNQSMLAVGVLDMDQFKPVNDTYGHEAGDALLREIARRFKSLVRETDFIARFGGDEFVVVIENLDEDQAAPQLTQALDRLHSAVEQPFEVLPGTFVTIDMTMGLALYPRHGTDADSLMREADAAMYQAKTRKTQRDSWWQLGTQSQDEPLQEQEMDAFSLDAAEFLRQSQPLLESILVTFVEAFYNDLVQQPEPAEILAALSSADRQKIKTQQADHLRFLLDPMTTRAEVMNRGQRVGRVHRLVGVNSIMLVQSYALYRQLLNRYLNLESMTARTRYRLMQLIDARLQSDLQSQLESGAHVVDKYQGISNHDLPLPSALWADVVKEELARLGHLPGIAGAILMRLDSRGIFIVEHSAGPKADAISQVLQSPESASIHDPASPRGQGIGALAWRSNQLQSVASYSTDTRHDFWQEVIQSTGLRSAMAIPVTDMLGHVVTLLVFYGAYPHQFETSWMRQFAYGLQKRWGDMWARTSGQATVLVMSQDEAHLLLDRLFSGGLSMFMQPIVDLKSGQAVKLEALARLLMPDGQVISPGVFLPLLGDSELNQVFRQGLDQTLAWLSRWDVTGLNLTASINLPPSTLLDPECPKWVADSLTRHGIAPERLYLELLETKAFDVDRQNITMGQLRQLGVKLAMDDLGSGYSSLKRLSTLPFDMIKVDQDLLKELYIRPLETLGLITTIINLGRYYRHDVTVEGLEDAGMIEVAAILGAQFGQGYSISRPMPAESIADWMCNTAIVPYAGHIHTLIGALAYQHHILMDDCQAKMDINTCPVGRFLVERGLQDSDAYRWHSKFHVGDNEAGKLLLNWLVEQVKNVGGL